MSGENPIYLPYETGQGLYLECQPTDSDGETVVVQQPKNLISKDQEEKINKDGKLFGFFIIGLAFFASLIYLLPNLPKLLDGSNQGILVPLSVALVFFIVSIIILVST